MKIGHSQKTMEKFYILSGQVLQKVDKTKYLGIMSPHVEYVTTKANRLFGLIRRNFKECQK